MENTQLEFNKIHRGRFSGSECYKLMGEKGGLFTQTAQTYILEKAAETLYDPEWIDTTSDNAATRWGKALEDDAREYYSLAFNINVDKPDPVTPEWSDEVVGSSDGIAYPEEGKPFGIEIKCPYNPAQHLVNMLMKNHSDLKKQKKEYYWQIIHYMLIFNFDYYEYVSYDPRYTGSNRMFVLPMYRKDVIDDINNLKATLLGAIKIKHEILDKLAA